MIQAEYGQVNVESTHLFVGPPKPAAAPWETAYRDGDKGIYFGRATHEMRALLRQNGLELAGDFNQYEDHMGIELLLASVLCARAAEESAAAETLCDYIQSHPASWILHLVEAVQQDEMGATGYYVRLLCLVKSLLKLLA